MSQPFDLRRARINAGYSTRALARRLAMNDATLRRLERGERIRPASAKPIADFFGVKVTDLMPLDTGKQRAA